VPVSIDALPVAPNLADAVSLLDARAVADAPRMVDAAGSERPTGSRFVRFTIGATSYAVGEAFVTELDRVPRITLVPQTPEWIRGVTNLRGEILSVVDLRLYLGLDPTSAFAGRMLVVRLPLEDFSLGLLVDAVDGIVTLEADAIHPPASTLEGPLAAFLNGISVVDDKAVAVLDMDRFLRSPDIRQFDETQEDSRWEAL
jgi:purine-binding chemotaxis protein CheW